MKSFFRQAIRKTLSQTLAVGAIGASVLGAMVINPAQAIPEAQIAEKLTNVPVYVVGNEEGLLLIPPQDVQEGDEPQPGLLVFMAKAEAESFVAEANEADPEFAASLQVNTTSLENIYQEFQSEDNSLKLVYVPDRSEATQANELGIGYQGGVPLFFPQFEDGSLAAIPDSTGENVFPMFFSFEDLNFVLNEIEEQNPEARAAISVGILPLEGMLREMQTSDDEDLNRVRLLPDSEAFSDAIQGESPSE